MRVDGTGRRNLTRSPEDLNWAPTWSPDGRIVYSSQRDSPGQPQLWSMAADGSDQRLIGEGWCEYAAPSPDGRFVCSAASGGRYDLVVVDGDGDRTDLTSTPETEFGAAWSPDGEWIAFGRDTGERWELLRIRADGTDEQVLASEGVFPTWGPDGLLAWSGARRHHHREPGRLRVTSRWTSPGSSCRGVGHPPRVCGMERRHAASGSPYESTIGFCRAVRAGDLVMVSGTAPVWPDGEVDPDPAAQARRCFEIALGALAELGGRPEDVVRTRQYVVSPDDVEAVGGRPRRGVRRDPAGLDDGRRRRSARPSLALRGRAGRRRR